MLKGKAVGCSGGGGGGNNCAADAKESIASTVVAIERPRKKLSFREPEIMGCYMKVKQETSATSTRRNKIVTRVAMPSAAASGTSAPAQSKNCLENLGGSFEDLDLEVGHHVLICHVCVCKYLTVEFVTRSLVILASKLPRTNSNQKCILLYNKIRFNLILHETRKMAALFFLSFFSLLLLPFFFFFSFLCVH